LTHCGTVGYAQKQHKRSLFINMTTVLPASWRAGLYAETFSGSPELFFDPLARPKRSKWQDRRIIPDNIIGGSFRKKLVVPCPGAVLFAGLITNRYYEVTHWRPKTVDDEEPS
jgi:hypothetical protein